MTSTACDLDTPAGVLSAVRTATSAAQQEECNKMVLAVTWAAMHSVDSMDDAACYAGFESELALAGPGAPLVAEFAVAELAVALRVTTDAGRVFLGLAMELRYRLPRVWKRGTAGDLAPCRRADPDPVDGGRWIRGRPRRRVRAQDQPRPPGAPRRGGRHPVHARRSRGAPPSRRR